MLQANALNGADPPSYPLVLPNLDPKNVQVSLGGKGCKKCGSLTHQCSSHMDCPFNKRRQTEAVKQTTTLSTQQACKKCGSTSHQRSNHKDCPFRKKTGKATFVGDKEHKDNHEETSEEEDESEGDGSEEDDESEGDDEEDDDSEDDESEGDDEEDNETRVEENQDKNRVDENDEDTIRVSSICSASFSCKRCGSLTHRRSNHKDCPYNKNRLEKY